MTYYKKSAKRKATNKKLCLLGLEITPDQQHYLQCFLSRSVAQIISVLPEKSHNFHSWGGGELITLPLSLYTYAYW